MKVKTSDGIVINTIEKTAAGGLVVRDQTTYNKFKQERENQLKIMQLETQVKELSELVRQLLNK